MSVTDVKCFDCWAAQGIGESACHKHATPEQLAAWEARINSWATAPHPMLAFLKGKRNA